VHSLARVSGLRSLSPTASSLGRPALTDLRARGILPGMSCSMNTGAAPRSARRASRPEAPRFLRVLARIALLWAILAAGLLRLACRAQHGCDPGNLIRTAISMCFPARRRGRSEGWRRSSWRGRGFPPGYRGRIAQPVRAVQPAHDLPGGYVAGIYTQVGGLQPGTATRPPSAGALPPARARPSDASSASTPPAARPNAPTVIWARSTGATAAS